MMNKKPIQITSLDTLTSGFRVWAGKNRPKKVTKKKFTDAWISQLAPPPAIFKNFTKGKLSWGEFRARYLRELYAPSSQDLIKPLALLSFRKTIALQCECRDHLHCPTQLLAKVIWECRKNGNFKLNY